MSESREFSVLIESAPDAIVLVTRDGQVALVNRRVFGHDPGDS
jgi:hypothetical protein